MSGERVTVSFINGESFETVNPFRVADEIRRLVGEVDSAKPDPKGNLVITTCNKIQTEILLSQHKFLGKEALLDCPVRLNSVEAYAHAPTLADVPDDEIIAELRDQGVVGVQRLRPKNGKPNPAIRLTILGKTIPPSIRAGFQDISLRPWRRAPLLCRRCAAYGHLERHCRSDSLQCLRCSGPHTTEDCQTSRTCCPHCPVLAAFYKEQDQRIKQNRPTTKTTTDASTQATEEKIDAATATSEPHRPTTSSVVVQTDDLPTFEGMVTLIQQPQAPPTSSDQTEDSEEKCRWDRRTRQGARAAAVPPPIPDRVSRPEPAPSEGDPELLPAVWNGKKKDEDHHYTFFYEDGTKPQHQVLRLYRDLHRVRVVDLDLRRGTRAHHAAKTGFYSDKANGRRLYLQVK